MTATKTRKAKKATEQARTAKLMTVGTSTVLALTTERDGTTFYGLTEIGADRGRGFQLVKADKGNGPEETYHVNLAGPESTCECKGFYRWNHCKHCEALAALVGAGKL
jgi:hypothetical protein